MKAMHLLYIESILGIKIGKFNANVAEFAGHLTLESFTSLCANSGVVCWQNPECPVVDKAYLTMPDASDPVDFAIDFNFNCIYVA